MVFKPTLANSGLKSVARSVNTGMASMKDISNKSLGASTVNLSNNFKHPTLLCHLAEDFKYAKNSGNTTEDNASTGNIPYNVSIVVWAALLTLFSLSANKSKAEPNNLTKYASAGVCPAKFLRRADNNNMLPSATKAGFFSLLKDFNTSAMFHSCTD